MFTTYQLLTMLCMKTHPNTVLEIRFNWKNPWKLLVGLKLINYLTELTCPAIGHIIVQKYTFKKNEIVVSQDIFQK